MDVKNTAQDAEPSAHAQIQADEQKEEIGYTFCDGCNEVPFCGIKFFKRGDVLTHIESWPGFPNSPLCSKGYATLQRKYNPNRLT